MARRIVLIAGFEAFNAELYRQAAAIAREHCPDLDVAVFCDRDLDSAPDAVAAALEGADALFASLIFDYDRVLWLKERVKAIPVRLIFESALELMAVTQLGKFSLGATPQGMPGPVRFILNKFGSSKEEDRLAGYLSFLKIGPKLLKYLPIKKLQDLRNWLTIYGYWNAGGSENIVSMLQYLGKHYLGATVGEIAPAVETPDMGLLHPDRDGYFLSPRAYLEWYSTARAASDSRPVVGILVYRKHVITQQSYIPQLIRQFERAGLIPLPIFINGVEGHVAVRDWMTTGHEQQMRSLGCIETPSLSPEAVKVDAIVSTIGFPLVGGPAGSMETGRQVETAKRILSAKNVPYFVSAPLLVQDIASWTRKGVGGLQSAILYALPELDGAIDPVPLGGLVGDKIYLVPERVQRLTQRVRRWVELRRKPTGERRIAIVLYGFPPGYGATGTAALLNVPESLMSVLKALKQAGYDIPELPEDGEASIERVKAADEAVPARTEAAAPLPATVSARTLNEWLSYLQRTRMERQWGESTQAGIKTWGDDFLIGGVRMGNLWIGVQPPLGIAGDPMRLMFERDLTPHPQYVAFYEWLKREFQADAIVHFGMHGTAEWLPGSPLGNTGYCWPDILLGDLPHLYVYAANNPSESMLAKRRGYGVLVSHNVPPYGRAGSYKELLSLRELIAEYREDPRKNTLLRDAILKAIVDSGLHIDCPFAEARKSGIEFTPENACLFSPEALTRYLAELYNYLQVLEARLFSSGLHVLGQSPDAEQLQGYLSAYFGDDLRKELIETISWAEEAGASLEAAIKLMQRFYPDERDPAACERIRARILEALEICDRLRQTPEEITNLLRGLNGEYILPAPGGDLLRDGPGVLPTGRNIHALDPYRMPSPGAYLRGREIGRKLLAQHQQERGGYPETVAVMLWGLDAIKTKGESLGIVLELVGAEPIKEGTGRIVRYELLPLERVGHPRIDILGNLSGIFRDSFANVIELLDDLFERAASAEEPVAQNFIRKHALALQSEGIERASARLFSNPAGDYGSLVNDRIVDSNWEHSDELGKTWCDRNVYSYGRKDRGQARPQILDVLLQSTERIVQQIDSVEYGLTDIQEYYANTGALKQAAEQKQGQSVTASFVESFSKDNTPRKLDELLRIEYRSKLLNPKWADAMAAQGSGGAYEISQRMTAILGWAGTAHFKDKWVYEQAAETYAFDPVMAERLRQANPEAFRNIVGRLIEACGRGFWRPDDEVLEKLQNLYDEAEMELEGVRM